MECIDTNQVGSDIVRGNAHPLQPLGHNGSGETGAVGRPGAGIRDLTLADVPVETAHGHFQRFRARPADGSVDGDTIRSGVRDSDAAEVRPRIRRQIR